ncbi:unnamed protein product [Phyllotreta striolata]|uniref:Glycoside hydrolase family 1 n=1 Tax=Phyllotreta striolata TaxID=444603 RepID=A0A9N9TFN4_PHYSR|nr:unnamed protein product [Phyllotreta striolata]
MDFPTLLFISLCVATSPRAASSDYSFPDEFIFGAGTSAYQTEGAPGELKCDNIWDFAIENNASIIQNSSDAKTADQSFLYNYYSEDIDYMAKMHIDHFRMSIPWPRLFADGLHTSDAEIEHTMQHYAQQFQLLKTKKINTIVTLYHWDLPQLIQDWGGWTNASNIDLFVNYTDNVFQYLSGTDYIDYLLTFNEPKQICVSGYGDGSLAPFLSHSGVLDYQCVKNVLKAHAAVYRLYQKNYADDFKCKISIALDGSWSEPKTSSEADQAAAKRRLDFEFGLYAEPLLTGDWPREVVERVKERSAKEKLPESRLPAFTEEEKRLLKGSVDFLALNYFDTRVVADAPEGPSDRSSYHSDVRVEATREASWKEDAAGNAVEPTGIRKFLNYMKREYGDREILITGNGFADDGVADDKERIRYLWEYLWNVAAAINEDGVKVFGYIYWSLIDGFEWTKGYGPHYGLLSVDSTLGRHSKSSADYYGQLIKERKVSNPYPTSSTSTTTETSTTTGSSTSTETSTTTGSSTSTETSTSTGSSTSTESPNSKGNIKFISFELLFVIVLLPLLKLF